MWDSGDDHNWLDHEAGPVVRPYTVTGGRVRTVNGSLDLLAYVVARHKPDADLVGFQPEHRRILHLTREPLSVAEVAARIDLAVGVVRVLIDDLMQVGLVSSYETDAAGRPPDDDVLQAVIDGLRGL
jgi:Protein of unknown function (DUF742)